MNAIIGICEQETNGVQFELLRLLTKIENTQNLFLAAAADERNKRQWRIQQFQSP